ncbi:MAG: helix-turn-helix domain-containing protein [bacterium]
MSIYINIIHLINLKVKGKFIVNFMNSAIINKLTQLNLSNNEAEVYTALVGLGQTSAGNIIKQTNLHRSVVYETLEKLISKKLVFKIAKKKIAYFQITDPNILLERANEQQKIVQELVPELKKLGISKLPEINIYEGLESYRKFWINITKKMPVGSTDYVAGSIGKKWQEYMSNSLDEFMQLRVKRKIKWKMIIFKRDDFEMDLAKKYPKLNEYRIISKGQTGHGNFNVFDDKKTLVLHSADEPMIIEIKNSNLVKVFQNIFDLLWEMGKAIKV